jgi:hypothetical protein
MKYELSGLVTLCMDYFLDGVTHVTINGALKYAMEIKDAFTLLEFSVGKDEPELRGRAIQLIQCFTKEALESKAFLDASRAVVEVVFTLDELSVSEIFLFKAV